MSRTQAKPNYSEALVKHLAEYKRTSLGIEEDGCFFQKTGRKLYPHILPTKQGWLNLLPLFSTGIREYLRSRPDIRMHRYFHHLNSSQAFAFNLFLPFFLERTPAPLMEAIGLTSEVACWEPEFIQNARERTNVDMAWWDLNNGPTYCEVKLTEREFGPASEKTNEDRRKYDEKLGEFYRPGLQGKCPDEFLERNFFLRNYQIFRNLWLATTSDNATVVFLMPRANYRLWDQLNPIVDRLCESLKSRIRIVAIEDVLKSLAAVHSPEWVSKYAELLRAKYLLPT